MHKTKIICTIGPASHTKETLTALIKAGMNVARFNFSHTSWPEVLNTILMLKNLREELGQSVGILIDLKGPEIRLGKIQEGTYLKEGTYFTIKNTDVLGNAEMASISYKNLDQDVKVGNIILIDDGLIKLEVKEIIGKDIRCQVLTGGFLSSHKSLNVPGISLNLPGLEKKDLEDINGAIVNEVDFLAASFVRNAQDILNIKDILNYYHSPIKVIAKIENKEGLNNFTEILKVADGIMVARGDLGVEIPFSEVPIWQKKIIKSTYVLGKPVITATQMLESMVTNYQPTRAEVSDVANAILDGTSALMLSEETAIGKYPIECVKTMAKIATDIESSLDYWSHFEKRNIPQDNFEFIINHALLMPAKALNIKAIFAYTKTGDTPRILASLRPKCPIYVLTHNKKVFQELSLTWGLYLTYIEEEKEVKEMIMDDINLKLRQGLIQKGDIILIAGGKYIPDDPKDINKNVGGIYQI